MHCSASVFFPSGPGQEVYGNPIENMDVHHFIYGVFNVFTGNMMILTQKNNHQMLSNVEHIIFRKKKWTEILNDTLVYFSWDFEGCFRLLEMIWVCYLCH